MKKEIFSFVVTVSLIVGLSSCKSKDSEPEFIDPTNVNLLSKVLIMPSGAIRQDGIATPTATSGSQAPVVISNVSNLITSNGGTVPLSFSYSNVTSNLGGCYVQVEGANTYYNLPYSSTSNSTGRLSVPIGLPTNVIDGRFYVIFSIYDISGRVSNQQRVVINVLRLGTGAIQISLSWDTPTDQDLYVKDPSGTVIYYGNKSSSTGGELDRDDIDGYGPENIFWLKDAPDGKYTISVDDYRNTSSINTYYVTVSTPNKTKTYTGTTTRGSTANVLTFTKSGNNYDY